VWMRQSVVASEKGAFASGKEGGDTADGNTGARAGTAGGA